MRAVPRLCEFYPGICLTTDEKARKNLSQGKIIIVIILGISFMQGIYTYVPETNHVPREHCVATILM